MKRDLGAGPLTVLLERPLPPQLLHAGADCLEIVGCSRL
jgi:hypothetical protein